MILCENRFLPPIVIYHDNCADGFCAAWAVRKQYPNATFIAAKYGDEPPAPEGRDVFIVDFSYPRDVLFNLREKAASLVVMDHHKTAQAALSGLGFCIFDMDKSGARLAWERFNTGQSPHWLVDYTEDRDLWRWKLPHSKEINSAIRSYPFDFEEWDSIAKRNPEEFIAEGAAILRDQKQTIASHVANAGTFELDGYTIPCVNCTTLISEVVGELAEGQPFAAGFFIAANGDRVYSLRSRGDGIDVSEIAKRHGGGGHKNAAGFTVKS